MWTSLRMFDCVAAIGSSMGWALMLHRIPEHNNKLWATINIPENAPYVIDEARPPFLYINETEFDLGPIMLMHLVTYEIGAGAHSYIANQARMSLCIWHGNPREGASPILAALTEAKSIQMDIFVLPRKIINVNFEMQKFDQSLTAVLDDM